MEVETQHFEFYNNAELCQSVNDRPKLSKLDECIKSIVKKEGYISCDVQKKMKQADGGNYLATLYEIDVTGKTADGDKDTAIFVKSIDGDCEAMELISVPDVYKTELFVYKELTKIFNELQDDANIPANERYNTVKCYEESYEKAIIMENITRKGFKTASQRMDVITINVAEECVKQLAKFHALSYVLEQKKPDYFIKKVRQIKAPHIFGEAWTNFVEKFSKMGLGLLDEKLRKKTEIKMPSLLKKIKECYIEESTKYCLCHGDYRPNNIMVKEQDGKVTVIPVDYQIIYFGCPIFDFIYFIYLSTDRQFRDTHMTDLKNLYYKSLEDFFQYFDMSAECIFSRKIFEHLYQDNLDFGLAISFVIGPFMFVDDNADIPDITKEAIVDVDIKLDDKYKDRLKETVEEFIDLGYL